MSNRKGGFKNQRNFVGPKPDNNRRFFNPDQNNQPQGQLVGLDPSLASNPTFYNNNSSSNLMQGQLQTNQLQANQIQANQMQAGQLLNSGNLNSVNLNQLAPSLQPDFNRPPSSTQLNPPPTSSMPTNNNANELEIIVMNREQWPYCEMLEKRFRQETCLKFIDLGTFCAS